MKNFNSNTDNKDEWLTPPYIIEALGKFDLDPCAPIIRPWNMAQRHYNINDNGLTKEWAGRVWLNPPYGNNTFAWIEKLAIHKKGIALIFARTETKGFHRQIWEKAEAVFFFEGRLRFYHVNGTQGGTANASSCLVCYSKEDANIIFWATMDNKIKGRFIQL